MSDVLNDMAVVKSERAKDFQSVYIALRELEKRIYTDDEVLQLPNVSAGNIYKKEWNIRADSCKKLVQHLSSKNIPYHILEVGCGNGWLSYQLSKIKDVEVLGIDINSVELKQAKSVFAHQPNLHFANVEIYAEDFFDKQFDVIVFAASVQYFNSFKDIMNAALRLLKVNGEIHIMDSHFYKDITISDAKKRSADYFKDLGFENMLEYYFHHSVKELEPFNFQILHDPNSFLNKISNRKNPFHWICIKAND